MNSKLKAYKFRIYPNKAQEVLLNKTFGCVRYAWNKNVDSFLSFDTETNPNPEFKTSTELRKEVEWMREVSASAVQQKEMDFKEFKKQYFKKLKDNTIDKIKKNYLSKCAKEGKKVDYDKLNNLGKPNFKKKNNHQSYRLPNQKFKIIDIVEDNNKIKVILETD